MKALGDERTSWGAHPTITAVAWLRGRHVLGGEATDFTPWLGDLRQLLHH
jgi:hypothetical protein